MCASLVGSPPARREMGCGDLSRTSSEQRTSVARCASLRDAFFWKAKRPNSLMGRCAPVASLPVDLVTWLGIGLRGLESNKFGAANQCRSLRILLAIPCGRAGCSAARHRIVRRSFCLCASLRDAFFWKAKRPNSLMGRCAPIASLPVDLVTWLGIGLRGLESNKSLWEAGARTTAFRCASHSRGPLIERDAARKRGGLSGPLVLLGRCAPVASLPVDLVTWLGIGLRGLESNKSLWEAIPV